MNIKAKLLVRIMADETLIAESDDPVLWRNTLAAMQSVDGDGAQGLFAAIGRVAEEPSPFAPSTRRPPGECVAKLAKEIGVTVEQIEAALSPRLEEPFLTLDSHYWSAMKSGTAERGPSAFSPMALAATMLALWFKVADLGTPTQAQVAEVLNTINVVDRNGSRGVQRSTWLQSRLGGQVIVNAARYATATRIAKAFCIQNWEVDPRKE